MPPKKDKNKSSATKRRNSKQKAMESSDNELTPNGKSCDPIAIVLKELTVRVRNSDQSSQTCFDRLDLMRFIRRNLKHRFLSHGMVPFKLLYNEKFIIIEVIIGTNHNNLLEDSLGFNSPKTPSRKMNNSLDNSFESLSLSRNESTLFYTITNKTKLIIECENLRQLTGLADIAGYQNQISALKDIISYPLSDPQLKTIGISAPKTALVFGPSGTGKTMTIRALMSEFSSEMSCIEINCADILSKSVEDSVSKLKTYFDTAIEESPSILFFDNIELCAKNSTCLRKPSTDSDKKILHTLISQMQDIPNDKDVIIIAATNKIDSLDMSLRKPGRLDIEIKFHVPLRSERLAILHKHLNKSNCNISDDILLSLAESESLNGFTGADLVLVCRQASLLAFKSGSKLISETDLKRSINVFACRSITCTLNCGSDVLPMFVEDDSICCFCCSVNTLPETESSIM